MPKTMYILGLNAYHGDSSAAIIADGELVAAVEEERFNRIKHWSGFPRKSIKYCLDQTDIKPEDLDYIAVNRNTRANFHKKILFTLRKHPNLGLIKDRLFNMKKIGAIKQTFSEEFTHSTGKIKVKVVNVEHHRAHLASSFFLSDFDKSTLVSVDGFGDFTSLIVATGRGGQIKPLYQVNYPHSLGIFYSALTQFLGFPKYGDEYKIMGLAGFGEPMYLDKMKDVILLKPKGRFALNLKYFKHHLSSDKMQWHNTTPSFGTLYSDHFCKVFGNPRDKDGKIDSYYKNIAASVQAMYEKALFHILNYTYELTGCYNLCLAGGCALNSLANGKIFDKTPFKEIYIHPAAHDGGGAVGAAYYLYNQILNKPRRFGVRTAYLGPEFDNDYISRILKEKNSDSNSLSFDNIDDIDELIKKTAGYLSGGKIVGWFQGKMEWGPRALGNRSILADPRREDMRSIINEKIKMREAFRPFAPSILQEYTGEYFEKDYPDPFMLKVYPIKTEKQKIIPAVTHVDGTGRLQTVNKKENPLYWKLIDEFRKLTGVPVLLNTSFNENEPIVCEPQQALDCFLRTKMDILVIGNFIVKRA